MKMEPLDDSIIVDPVEMVWRGKLLDLVCFVRNPGSVQPMQFY